MFVALASCAPDRSAAPRLPGLTRGPGGGGIASLTIPGIRISEIHYDNAGTDTGEGVEVSGPAGTDLTGWSIVLYNGSGGASYDTKPLTGAIPNICDTWGVVAQTYPSNGIQNGSPDGVALIDAGGRVIEFLSYEGTFIASNGPAQGLRSRDIGVSETGTESVAAGVRSLKRTGDDSWSTVPPPLTINNFGACNDKPFSSLPAVARLTLTAASTNLFAGTRQLFDATAFDAGNGQVRGATVSWSSSAENVASVSAGGVVTATGAGDAEITATTGGASATLAVTVIELPPLSPPIVTISEIHYDNDGTDIGEAIEIEGPAGTSVSGWSLVLYNGNGGVSYDTRTLAGALVGASSNACEAGRGVLSVAYPSNGIQNGSPDGVALVDGDGKVVEFISYEGSFRATDGPAIGRPAVDIGREESSSSAPDRSLQRDAIGWFGPAAASFGRCNKAPAPFVSIVGRVSTDPPLPVGYEDQLFATFNDGRGGTTPATFTWSSDTPQLASVDEDGVVRALGPGTGVLRATSPDGASGTTALALVVATASTTASYVGNTEFGEPSDADPSDDFVIRRDQYTTSFNRNRGIPNWVSFNLEQTHFGPQDRCDCFTFDPALPADFARYTTADYTGAGAAAGFGIDRGHLTRSFDRTSGNLDNATTFLFSNIIPQASDNNQGPWAAMEIAVGDLARFGNKEIYVIAGASGSQGTVKNEGRITIPEYVWKVVVIMPRNTGLANVQSYRDVEVIAVIMPNKAGIRDVNWEEYRTTVNAIEALSGYDVLGLLQDRIEAVVETGMRDVLAQVDALVDGKELSRGNGNSLAARLEAAAASLERGNGDAAANQLRAFINEVEAMQRSRRLTVEQANVLLAGANRMLGVAESS